MSDPKHEKCFSVPGNMSSKPSVKKYIYIFLNFQLIVLVYLVHQIISGTQKNLSTKGGGREKNDQLYSIREGLNSYHILFVDCGGKKKLYYCTPAMPNLRA